MTGDRGCADPLKDAGVLVTGGASGLGAATVRAFHARGALVAIADVDIDGARSLAAELGPRAEPVGCDVAVPEDVRSAIAHAEGAARGLRAAVTCAGIGFIEELVDEEGEPHALESFERLVRTNLVGTFNVLRLAASAMRRNEPDSDGERGVIVTTGSLSGLEGAAGETAYAASKGGVDALTLPRRVSSARSVCASPRSPPARSRRR